MSQPLLLVLMLWLVLSTAVGPAFMATAPNWELHHAYKHSQTCGHDKVTVHICVNMNVKMHRDLSTCVFEGVQTAVQNVLNMCEHALECA